ncbi:hypothetical protein QW180_01885 [Vibrio sinaloensis]|nr:hypothetical protein [Vibrio sinaloensis]
MKEFGGELGRYILEGERGIYQANLAKSIIHTSKKELVCLFTE